MMERDSSAARLKVTNATTSPGIGVGVIHSVETAMAVEFVASLFRHVNDGNASTSFVTVPGWNVTFPGLSLQPPDPDTAVTNASHHHHHDHPATRRAAEAHAVDLLRRPIAIQQNASLRTNAYHSFVTLVEARLQAYVRRWPAVAGVLQYRILPATLLSRFEVLKGTTTDNDEEDHTKKNDPTTTKLAVCCWSMAMDLILEPGGPADHDAGDEEDRPPNHPTMSVSFSTLGSILRGTYREHNDDGWMNRCRATLRGSSVGTGPLTPCCQYCSHFRSFYHLFFKLLGDCCFIITDASQHKHLIVELDLQVLLAEMIRQASTVVSAMVKHVGQTPPVSTLPPPPCTTTNTTTTKEPIPPPLAHNGTTSSTTGSVGGRGRSSSCDDDVFMMPPPPPRQRKRPAVMVVSPDLSSISTTRCGGVPTLDLAAAGDDTSLSVDQCADIIDTCLTEFTTMMSSTTSENKRAKLVMSSSDL
jgi:hypothetical protein